MYNKGTDKESQFRIKLEVNNHIKLFKYTLNIGSGFIIIFSWRLKFKNDGENISLTKCSSPDSRNMTQDWKV